MREVQYRALSVMARSVSDADWAAIVDKAIQQAREGDAVARAWLSRYLLPQEPDPFTSIEAGDTQGE